MENIYSIKNGKKNFLLKTHLTDFLLSEGSMMNTSCHRH